MRSFLKGLATLTCVVVLIGMAALYILAHHSTVAREFVCTGETRWTGEINETKADRAFVALEEYRWWVHLWAKADGNMTVQLDEATYSAYVSRVKKVGSGFLTEYIFWNDAQTEFLGAMRMANLKFTLKFHPSISFEGTCQPRLS
jgi:hypothetical protein